MRYSSITLLAPKCGQTGLHVCGPLLRCVSHHQTSPGLQRYPTMATEHADVGQLCDRVRELLRESRDLKCDLIKLDNDFLAKFLRARNYDATEAANLICGYFRFRADHKQLFADISSNDQCKQALKDNVFALAPNVDGHSERVVVFSPGKWDPAKYDSMTLVQTSVIVFEHALLDDTTQKVGMHSERSQTWE